MYFYVDESGHTGPNLFDPNQPFLFYGLLSCRENVDELAQIELVNARKTLGVARLHATEIGNEGLERISPILIKLQDRLNLEFDFFRLKKIDHAVICFFDQVFDQGMNPAVPWAAYWTPIRYIVLSTLSRFFDQKLLEKAWKARLNRNSVTAAEDLQALCGILIDRIQVISDKRLKEVLFNSLEWAKENPLKISYNVKSKRDAISVMPNAIGFQSVLIGLANRLKENRADARGILVDRQSQFNKEQKRLSDWYRQLSGETFQLGPGLPEVDYSGMPDIEIGFGTSEESAGLELVDIYLWIFKRWFYDQDLPPGVNAILSRQLSVGATSEISLEAIEERWLPWFQQMMSENFSDEVLQQGRVMVAEEEENRLRLVESHK